MNLLKGGWAVLCICLFSIFLSIIARPGWMPDWTEGFVPDWIVLSVFYWAKYAPSRIGVFGAWLLGLLADLITPSPLGLHAFCLCGVVYVVMRTEARLRLSGDRREYLILTFAMASVATIEAIVLYLVQDVTILFLSIGGTLLASLLFWLPFRETMQLVRRRFVDSA